MVEQHRHSHRTNGFELCRYADAYAVDRTHQNHMQLDGVELCTTQGATPLHVQHGMCKMNSQTHKLGSMSTWSQSMANIPDVSSDPGSGTHSLQHYSPNIADLLMAPKLAWPQNGAHTRQAEMQATMLKVGGGQGGVLRPLCLLWSHLSTCRMLHQQAASPEQNEYRKLAVATRLQGCPEQLKSCPDCIWCWASVCVWRVAAFCCLELGCIDGPSLARECAGHQQMLDVDPVKNFASASSCCPCLSRRLCNSRLLCLIVHNKSAAHHQQ